MAVKIDYAETAKTLVELAGGKDNIKIVNHCMTRLRFTLKDPAKADKDAIKKVRGVLGLVEAGGQTQIVLGENVGNTYEEVLKQYGFEDGGLVDGPTEIERPSGVKGYFKAVIDFISEAVSPMVPSLVAGGLLKVLLLLIGMAVPSFSSSPTNTILGYVANAPFYFMPIYVAYGGARKLNATPVYAMTVAAALLTPGWVSMVSNLKADGLTSTTVFGIPALAVTYNNSLLPALFIAVVAAYAEKFFNKVVPGILKSLLVGVLTLLVTGTLAFTILGPFGDYVGSIIANVFIFLGGKAAPIAIGVLAMCLPWLIMFGMHHSISPFMSSNIATIGFDAVIRPAFLLHNMCEGGAALGIALKAKDPEYKSQAFSIAVGCILAGVTEPCIYGFTFKLKKPMIGVMAGGLVGGIVAGLLHVKAYVMGYSTIMALPIFMDTMISMAVAVVVGIVTACIVTYIIGFDQDEAHL
ncbi:MAG: PTS transporter subunit EIIC [Erysipelotrichaceae bacterium]|nr:PTS transporter subunit EIIC [Erysipelotrichaceae bacterium]